LAESDAIVLFAERARGADAGFATRPDNADAIAAICRRLDGVPLAIEMAAARAPSLGCEAVLSHLDDRFKILTGGRRMAMPRHRTLQATLDWSHDLLNPCDAKVFRQLGVFAADFSLNAAAAIASDDALEPLDVIDSLAHLVGKSLIIATTTDNRTRYSHLETTRAYARNKLAEAGEFDSVSRRYASWFDSLCTPSWAESNSQVSDEELDARYFVELGNIRRALEWAFDTGGDVELGLSLLAKSRWMWDDPTLQGLLATALPLISRSTPTAVRAALLSIETHVQMMLSPALAVEHGDVAIAAVRDAIDNPLVLADVLDSKGFALWFVGRLAEAEPLSRESRKIVKGLPPSRIRAQAMGLEAALTALKGSPDHAQPIFDKLISELRSFGANGLANFWQSVAMRLNRGTNPDAEIAAWRDLLSRIRPNDQSAEGTKATASIELVRCLAQRGAADDLDEAIDVARVYFKAGSITLAYRLMPPMAMVAIRSGRTSDAALLMGFADARRREAGEVTLTQPDFDRLWTLLETQMAATEIATLGAKGAKLTQEAAIRIAVKETSPTLELVAA
jgi:hypothetical protein